jgi:hypothetical protein
MHLSSLLSWTQSVVILSGSETTVAASIYQEHGPGRSEPARIKSRHRLHSITQGWKAKTASTVDRAGETTW